MTPLQRLADTERLLRLEGLNPKNLAPGFVPFWLRQGKSPAEIVAIACGYPTAQAGESNP